MNYVRPASCWWPRWDSNPDFTDFEPVASASWTTGPSWWVSPDSNRDAPMEHSALQAGAANRIRLTPEPSYELGGEPGNRTQSRVNAWHVSSVLACHLPRSPWRRDEDSNPMRLVWNQAALPGASRLKIWRRVGDSNSCALAVRQFSGLLGYQLPIPSAL